MIGNKWKRTDDAYGHLPTFKIKCCRKKMVFRLSVLLLVKCNPIFGKDKGFNLIRYKCLRCSKVESYHRIDDLKYLEKIKKIRQGNEMFIPSKEKWIDEDLLAAKKLSSLGYI